MQDDELRKIMEKYRRRLADELGDPVFEEYKVTSREYEEFKKDILPGHFTLYEKWCQRAEKILNIGPDKKKVPVIDEAIRTAHLNITPAGSTSLSFLAPFVIIFAGLLLTVLVPMALGKEMSIFFLMFFVVFGLGLIFPLQNWPMFLANNWRLKASNQMVLCIFYIVTYMRHTSNLELAIEFASNHLTGPLALDLKKVLWDVETEKFATVKESLDFYLETWKKHNLEFVEAMHLVESSLYESDDARRLELLDKSLDVILEETYERMLHYAQNLKTPVTTLHMLGVILPILGLVILPLMTNFMPTMRWYYLAMVYNFALPVLVFYMGYAILATRPTGYGDTDISSEIPQLQKLRKTFLKIGGREIEINAKYVAVAIACVLILVALAPLVAHLAGVENLALGPENLNTECNATICAVMYRTYEETGYTTGPFDITSGLFSLLIPLGLGLGLGTYYKLVSKKLVRIREESKELEQEFASALFQLGNRLGDGLPAEIAFEKTGHVMQDTNAGKFFRQVTMNIQKLGMSVPAAIFDANVGAIVSFPSRIIESAMKVLVESIKKGPKIAAQALINISRYLKEMHRVSERLKDLLSEVITSMRSQIKMLAPVIAGIVVGITSMITNILGKLGPVMQAKAAEDPTTAESLPELFGIGIPMYYFQIIVGVYVVQIVYILTVLSNGIENGSDRLNQEDQLGKNLVRSTVLYVFIAAVISIIFNIIANIVVGSVFAEQP